MGASVLSPPRLTSAARTIIVVYADPADVLADRLLSVYDGRLPTRTIAAGDVLPTDDELVERHGDLFEGVQ